MADRALSKAREHAPWRAGTAWWVTGLQGAGLIVIGLFFILSPAAAGGLLFQLIALLLLIQSVANIVANLRASPGNSDPYGMLRAGIGATVGVFLVLRDWLVPTLDSNAARNILGIGLLAYALIGLADALIHRSEGESWYGPLVTAILLIVLAVVLLTSGQSNALDRVALLGWIALIGGAVLLFLAWRAREQQTA